jgi:hypothetical protein
MGGWCAAECCAPQCLPSHHVLWCTAVITFGCCLGGGSRPALMAFSTSLAACSRRFRFSFCVESHHAQQVRQRSRADLHNVVLTSEGGLMHGTACRRWTAEQHAPFAAAAAAPQCIHTLTAQQRLVI